ncbi:alpha-ketoglutarate-dependent dioxygenase alkB homolog 7, mitochondrial isoform X2 [Drosophila novamexicana]|uniref:alpha-ketoglutarate-dependent dioxygenase alkB homolog 7, mitochondrial isoform X2 n=1 Tax=Drosophila novamexicana TaxID=47314 RepID=UPI0011E58B03|nr:alpha-ketoglutarate-dependent dioxygenase alkB homolog 7, mitochondrial isoform X2 [Drosophila novamexicana]
MVISYRGTLIRQILRRCHRAVAANKNSTSLTCFHGVWPPTERRDFEQHMRIVPDFISEAEEKQLHEEIEPYMSRLRYEFDHWDDAIHGFRETERKKWYPKNRELLERVRQVAFNGEIMPYVHILDLAPDGVIKPHVDSTRYCGNTISGISLLSDSVMRLVRADAEKYQQNSSNASTEDTSYRQQPEALLENNFYADLLLPRRSLYIMSHTARYNFTHEILGNEHSQFLGNPVKKTRRISIICRNEP